MRFNRYLLAILTATAAGAGAAAAQSDAAAPAHQLSLDAGWIGLDVGYAVRSSESTSFGVSLGAGGNWANYMVLAGRHFAESNGLSYQPKDGATGKAVYELARGAIFVRRHFDSGLQVDVGLKASGFLHFDSSDDDPGFGAFAGVKASGVWYRWRRLGLGSELDAGGYFEGGNPELGVNVAPLFLRLTIP
jgi:hypothetical protein